jgi:pseudouridine-5'-phosphate glycosidase
MIIEKTVQQALANNQAIVALESTIITHGMPYPENLITAQRLEKIVRDHHAVPATIAVINGDIHIGLTQTELTMLAKTKFAIKIARDDVSIVLAQKKTGGTTVATTMFLAAKAGIHVFATGGIGGVHRGGDRTFDISGDLQALSDTDVIVVSAGAKAILDLPKTLEYLETKAVPVIGYRTKQFPAFYYSQSGLKLKHSVDDLETLTTMIRIHRQLKIPGGILIANPIPDAYALDATMINQAIHEALNQATSLGVLGNAVTPFLLAELERITQGKSLKSNIELIAHNAALASDIACDLVR